jgi:uncharacterized protein YdaU (DUF1376 family)
MRDRLPWFKCYPEKLLGAIAVMKPDEGYIYMILLLRIYETEGKCDDSVEVLSLRSRLSLARARAAIEGLVARKKLVLKDGVWSNPVAADELKARESRTESAKTSANARWEKAKENQQNTDAFALQSQSDGSAIKTKRKKERKKAIRPVKSPDGVYPEEFEALWRIYPRTTGTSKKKAHDQWGMLSLENQTLVKAAVPIYAEMMRREGRPQDKIKHMQWWLSEKVYETLSGVPVATAAAKAAMVDWHKTAKREQWIKVLPHWRANYSWNPVWGPAPGKPGCMLPEDLLTEMEKYQIILQRDGRKAAEAAMSDASQLRDAINAAHAVACVNTQLTRLRGYGSTQSLEPLWLAETGEHP